MSYEPYKPFIKNGKRYAPYGNGLGFATLPKAKRVLDKAMNEPDIDDAFIEQFNDKRVGRRNVVLYRTKKFR